MLISDKMCLFLTRPAVYLQCLHPVVGVSATSEDEIVFPIRDMYARGLRDYEWNNGL